MYTFARQAARVVPRTVARVHAKPAIRSYTPLCSISRIQQAWRTAAIKPSYAAFSTSTARYEASDIDQELSAKLASELAIEQENADVGEELPGNLQDFIESSQFQIHDVLGEEEVVLTKSFGNEKIRVSFTIADINSIDPEADYEQDPALMDEEESSMQQGGAQTKGAVSQGRTQDGNVNVMSEGRNAPADHEELADDESPVSDVNFPVRVNITIEKPNARGAVQVEATAQDGMIVIDNVYHYAKKELADAKTTEQDWERRNLYTGPPYGNLDQDLQIILEKYLEERGITTDLALWIPEYVDHKEQKEYMNWLSEIKGFVEA